MKIYVAKLYIFLVAKIRYMNLTNISSFWRALLSRVVYRYLPRAGEPKMFIVKGPTCFSLSLFSFKLSSGLRMFEKCCLESWVNGDRDAECESRSVKMDRIPFQRTNFPGYEAKHGFSDPKIHINYGRTVTMTVSKAKAPSWLPPLPGCERSANMEYAEWAPVGCSGGQKMDSWLAHPSDEQSTSGRPTRVSFWQTAITKKQFLF